MPNLPRLLCALIIVGFAAPALAEAPPGYFALPEGVSATNVEYLRYFFLEIGYHDGAGKSAHVEPHGRFWRVTFPVPAGARPSVLEAALRAKGWEVFDSQPILVARHTQAGHEAGEMSFPIEVNPATFEARGRSLTGELWMVVDGRAFPAEHWNDFVVVILGWWLQETASLLGQGGQSTLRFMDGPWWLDVDATAGSEWRVSLVDNHGLEPSVVHATTVSSEVFVTALREAASVSERRCNELGWSSPDLVTLRGALKATAG